MNLLCTKIWGSLGGTVIVAVALSACGTAPGASLEQKSEPAAVMSGKMQSLQRQIRERDKRIEELEFQLNALKLIQQDFEKQRNPIRPPATLTPIK